MQGNVTQDTRFASLKNNGDLAELVVTTKKHISHPLVYGLIKLALTLPVATAIVDVNWCFSAMKIVKQWWFYEPQPYLLCRKSILIKIPNEELVQCFHAVKDRRGMKRKVIH